MAPGTVVISSGVLNAELHEKYVQVIAGNKIEHRTCLDKKLQGILQDLAIEKAIPSIRGKTFCTDDFYEGQMRLDGYFGDYTLNDKMQFLKKLKSHGVVNIEMESTCFSSFTHRAGFPAAVVCVILTNRMEGDQVSLDSNMEICFFSDQSHSRTVRGIRNETIYIGDRIHKKEPEHLTTILKFLIFFY